MPAPRFSYGLRTDVPHLLGVPGQFPAEFFEDIGEDEAGKAPDGEGFVVTVHIKGR